MSRGHGAHRTDGTAKALIAAAEQYGWRYLPSDGRIDGTLWQPSTGRLELVDFKAPKGALTGRQQRLVDAGWPIRFVRDLAQLDTLLRTGAESPR